MEIRHRSINIRVYIKVNKINIKVAFVQKTDLDLTM